MVALIIKKEIEEYIITFFIVPINYSPWISNVVHIDKPNGKIRCCTDFRDINKACPKDTFPFPNIDMIIDSSPRHDIIFHGFIFWL